MQEYFALFLMLFLPNEVYNSYYECPTSKILLHSPENKILSVLKCCECSLVLKKSATRNIVIDEKLVILSRISKAIDKSFDYLCLTPITNTTSDRCGNTQKYYRTIFLRFYDKILSKTNVPEINSLESIIQSNDIIASKIKTISSYYLDASSQDLDSDVRTELYFTTESPETWGTYSTDELVSTSGRTDTTPTSKDLDSTTELFSTNPDIIFPTMNTYTADSTTDLNPTIFEASTIPDLTLVTDYTTEGTTIDENDNNKNFMSWNSWTIGLVAFGSAITISILAVSSYHLGKIRERSKQFFSEDLEPPSVVVISRARVNTDNSM